MSVTTYDTAKNHVDELPSLIEQADCISLHIPLTDETKGFFDAKKLCLMKKGAILVNTARGPIVKEDSLYDALKKQHIKAVFDVFWQEPYQGKLMEFAPDRFMVSPHVASTCKEFIEGCAKDFLNFVSMLEDTSTNRAIMSFEKRDVINCGILGYGKMGRIRHSAIMKCGGRAKVTKVFDVIKPDNLDPEFVFVKTKMIYWKIPKIDAIFICTPNFRIPELCIQV